MYIPRGGARKRRNNRLVVFLLVAGVVSFMIRRFVPPVEAV